VTAIFGFPPREQDYGGDIVSWQEDPSTADDQAL
jgi:hypothetical protein